MTELETLQKWLDESRKGVFFRRGGGVYRERYPGFPQRGRPL